MLPLLSVHNLTVDFVTAAGATRALDAISFTVQRNEIVALVGESGSGKSVTSLSILQLLPAPPAVYRSGEILFSPDGKQQHQLTSLGKKQMQEIRGNRIAMIFQEPMTSLNPVLTCGDQVMEAILRHKKISKKYAKQITLDWFNKVKLPDPAVLFGKYPHQVSGGQKQRVMIAMAMCCEPDLLICDEPTTALDVTVQKTILRMIRDLQQQTGMGVIFITHDLGVVAEIADRALVMYKGSVVEQNPTRVLFLEPRHPYTKALLACRPVNHERGKRLPVVSDFMGENPVTAPVKAETMLDHSVPGKKEPAVLLSVRNLSVHFPLKKKLFGKAGAITKAVDNVSFELYRGETLGLVGESGCGKTTLGRTLLRLLSPTAGAILYKDQDITRANHRSLLPLRKEIQIVFQDPYSSLNPRMTIGQAIEEPLLVHGVIMNRKERRDKVYSLLEKVKLNPEHFHRYPHEFSGGQRQRIVIARALALHPSFVVCDESVSALDVSVQAQVLNLLNDLKREFGFTVIFISHDLSVVRYISDRIMVMNKGRIEETGLADDVYFRPVSPYTRTLIDSIPKGILPV